MAAPKENLQSLGHLTGTEQNTFTNHSVKNSSKLFQADFSNLQSHLRVMHLQQHWQELKERERAARQHNRQLMQQLEKAQDMLREMLARSAAMKTIRMEYERLLVESTPLRQQQIKKKTQTAQWKALPKGHKVDAPLGQNNQNSHSDYNQDVSSHLPYIQSSWLTQHQSHSRVSQFAREEAETSGASSSRSERGGGSRSSHLSQELDIKPVRLSSGHTENSESSRDSSQTSRKRKKIGRSHCTSTEKEEHSSQESSRSSNAVVNTSVEAIQRSGNDSSSGKNSTTRSRKTRRRGGRQVAESPRMETVAKEKARSKGDESGSQSSGEEAGSQTEECTSENAANYSPDDKSESCSVEVGGICIKPENKGGAKTDLGGGNGDDVAEEKDKCLTEEEQEERDDDKGSARKNTTEEEEETGAEDEIEEQECEDQGDDINRLKKKDCEKRQQGPASSQDEDEGERCEEKTEEDEGSDKEEQRNDEEEPEEKRDSEDIIISKENRSKKMPIVPGEASEDYATEKGSKTGSSDDSNDFSEDDDIENLLAPQEQRRKEEKDLKAEEKHKAICDNVEMFQVKLDRSTESNHQSDSDDFYD